MKRFLAFVPLAALAVIVLLSAHFVSAGPIVPKDIGADAKWFGHVGLLFNEPPGKTELLFS